MSKILLNSSGRWREHREIQRHVGDHDPDIFLPDEPTSGLDPLMQNRFVELIGQEKDKGKTMILSSQVWSWQGRHIQTRNIKKSPLRSFVWRVLSPPKNQRVSRPAQKERHPLFVSGRIAGGIGVGGGAEEDLRSRKEWLFSAVGGKIKEKKG